MRCAIASAIVVPTCIAIGWYSHAWWVTHERRGAMKKITDHLVTVTVLVMAFVVIGSTIFSAVSDARQNEKIEATVLANEEAIYKNCVNANESRRANIELWDFILGAELADQDNNPAETEMSKTILPWIHQVYRERDCNDLSKTYEIPPVPKIPNNVMADQ